ncbi:S-layer homology domain-containing protein [Candidatus Formimonas warabiya]|uniref:SLH domain-containing protein n=1 Tax=Formimonas warabiya TaxID=1761012 RepID=A0A3G1L0A0_FORW1|nr:S-layer homology domain-containing protein [Candidatus Formimonas warabiya]ATW28090.1 hypothetical protein DCMF_28045 [Candidatus Formimonas warabiya]
MKKTLALFIIMGLILATVPLASIAQEPSNAPIQVEKAIEIAKGLFQISSSLDQFDSTYEQNEYANVWSLRWYNNKGDGEVNVRVDADSGEIAGYNAYDPQDYTGKYSSIPKISRKEGESIALNFIKKVAPSKANQIILKPNNETSYGGPVFHQYSFNRVINGVEYPANNISVEVNGQTGQVRSFNVSWEKINVTAKTPKLTLGEAEKIFTEKFGFELKYLKPQTSGTTSKPIMTIYEINNPYQVAIDASSGEIVQDDYYGPYYDRKSMMGGGEAANDAQKPALSPIEQRIADELKGLISKESALEIAKKAAGVPDNFKLNGASLNKDWDFPELRIWSFQWNREEKDHYGWASAEIDAKTGKVLAFDFSENNNPIDSSVPLDQRSLKIKSKSAAEKLVTSFLEDNYPEVVGNLRAQTDNYVRPYPAQDDNNQPNYFFPYERLVDGIPFSQNYVNATVDSYTGKISSFRIRFLDLDFPATDQVLDQTQFTADFFAENHMILVYSKDKDQNLRLVYKLAPLESYRFNAQSGEMIGFDGEPVKDHNVSEITDIKGHWAEQAINTLNQLGLLHYENGLFQPNGEITQAEIMKALVKSTNSYLTDSTEGNWYDSYYQQAKQSGLITAKEMNPSASVTREELAKYLTRTMVGDKYATLNIYKVDFKDAAKITPGYAGYVAIVSGLGIMSGDGANFNPQTKALKGEACAILVKYLKTEK